MKEKTESELIADQLRLLNEMREEAKKSIVRSIVINDNSLSLASVVYRDEIVEDRSVVHVRFLLNNKYRDLITYIDREENNKIAEGAVYQGFDKALYDVIKKKFTEVIVEELADKALFEIMAKIKGNERTDMPAVWDFPKAR